MVPRAGDLRRRARAGVGRPVPEYRTCIRPADPRLPALPVVVRRVHPARARLQGRRVLQSQIAGLPDRPCRDPAGDPVQRPASRRRARLGRAPASARGGGGVHGNRPRHGPALSGAGDQPRRGPHPAQTGRVDRHHGTARRLLPHGHGDLSAVHPPRVPTPRRARGPARLRAGGVDMGPMGRPAGFGAAKGLYGRARAPYGRRLHLVERPARPGTRPVGDVPAGHLRVAAETGTAHGRIHGGLVPVLQVPRTDRAHAQAPARHSGTLRAAPHQGGPDPARSGSAGAAPRHRQRQHPGHGHFPQGPARRQPRRAPGPVHRESA